MGVKRRQRVRRGVLILAFALFPLTFHYYSPVVILAGAAVGVATGSLLLFSAQFVFSLFLGRAFCGWACPVGGLSEWLAEVRDRPAPGGRWDLIKWLIWLPWVGMLAVLVARAGGYSRIEPLYMMPGGLPLSEWSGAIAYLGVLVLVAVLGLAVGRRAFCHLVCWMAPGMILGSRLSRILHLPRLHLVAHPEQCIRCARCDHACPMSLGVSAMVASGEMDHDECVLCQSCVDVCPKNAISNRFGRPDR
ncbi:MAG: 4Fe-4S binding protein [Anaerolineae bacterium]